MKNKLPKYSASNPRGFYYYHFPDVTEKVGSETDLPICHKCGATLLLFDEHKCKELKYPAYHLREATKKIEESKLETLSSSVGHKDIIPETNEADYPLNLIRNWIDFGHTHESLENMLEQVADEIHSSRERARQEGRQERELYKLGASEERNKWSIAIQSALFYGTDLKTMRNHLKGMLQDYKEVK